MSAPLPSDAFADARPLTYGRSARAADADVRGLLPLVRRVAWHVAGLSSAVEVEDLVQVGLVALAEAVATGQDRTTPQFRQYLRTRLRGAMIDELRRHATASRGAMRRRRAHAAVVSALRAETGAPPTDAAVAERLGVTVERLRQDYGHADQVRLEALDEVYADDLPWFASDEPDQFERLAQGSLRDALAAAVAALPEREQLVIQLYHVEELNLEEIGQVLGVGAARVCQIKAAAHGRLKKALAGLR